MWARTNLSTDGRFTGLLAYNASEYLWTSPMTSQGSMSHFSASRTRTDHKAEGA